MSERNSGCTISTPGLLGVLFVGLKLTGVINWSWWWVTLPFWGALAIAGVIILGMVIVAAIADAVTS